MPVSMDDFIIPMDKVYLAGMSLGCLPKQTKSIISEELDVWGEQGVNGHGKEHMYGRSWYGDFEARCNHLIAPLLGAHEDEVAVMGELSANLNMLFMQFYKPTAERYKIPMEPSPFP